MEEKELLEQFKKEFAQLQGKPFLLETTAVYAWVIMSHLQLALRHPKNVGPTSAVAKQVAEHIIETLAPQGSVLRKVADRGWNPEFDEEF